MGQMTWLLGASRKLTDCMFARNGLLVSDEELLKLQSRIEGMIYQPARLS